MRIDPRAATLAGLLVGALASLGVWLATPAEPHPCDEGYGECDGYPDLPDANASEAR